MEQLLSLIEVLSNNYLSKIEFSEFLNLANLNSIILIFFSMLGVCFISYLIFKLTLIGIKITILGSLIYGAVSYINIDSNNSTGQNYNETDNNKISLIINEAIEYGMNALEHFYKNNKRN